MADDDTEDQNPGSGSDADEDLAAAWGDMVDDKGGGDSGSGESAAVIEHDIGARLPDHEADAARVLNQDEIDSLLGFENEDDGEKIGIQAILNSTLVSYERLPMLEVVFDRLVRLMTTTLRNFTSDNVEVSLDAISSIRFGDYLNSIPLSAMLAVFKAEEWDNYALITVDSALIYSIVDVLLGGRRGTAAMRIEGRPYTTIERNLVERMVLLILSDLSAAFEPLSPVTMRFDRLETNPRFATIARPANAAILVRMRVDMEDRGGKFDMLLPYATLEPVRELLLQMFMGEKFGRDSIWESHLAKELWGTDIEVDVLMDQQMLHLSDIARLKAGDTLLLNTAPSSNIVLRCGGVVLTTGRMGRVSDRVSVCVNESVVERVEN